MSRRRRQRRNAVSPPSPPRRSVARRFAPEIGSFLLGVVLTAIGMTGLTVSPAYTFPFAAAIFLFAVVLIAYGHYNEYPEPLKARLLAVGTTWSGCFVAGLTIVIVIGAAYFVGARISADEKLRRSVTEEFGVLRASKQCASIRPIGMKLSAAPDCTPYTLMRMCDGMDVDVVNCNGETSVTLKITDEAGKIVAKIDKNAFELGSPLSVWKSNRNDCALEVIAPDDTVAFQAVLREQGVVELAGAWGGPSGCVFTAGDGELRPLFRYPTKEHPGILIDE